MGKGDKRRREDIRKIWNRWDNIRWKKDSEARARGDRRMNMLNKTGVSDENKPQRDEQ